MTVNSVLGVPGVSCMERESYAAAASPSSRIALDGGDSLIHSRSASAYAA